MRILIVNPNTSRATNERIRAIAAPLVRESNGLEVLSAPSGIELIESVAQSNATIPAVLSVVDERHAQVDAIIIAAFSDPGLSQARQAASCPVFGISESAMKTAARIADRFAIVTLNAELRDAIAANAVAYGYAGELTGVRILPWSVATVSADPSIYRKAFAEACAQAVGRRWRRGGDHRGRTAVRYRRCHCRRAAGTGAGRRALRGGDGPGAGEPDRVTRSPEIAKAQEVFEHLHAYSSDPPGVTRTSYGDGENFAHRLIAEWAEDLSLEGRPRLRRQPVRHPARP